MAYDFKTQARTGSIFYNIIAKEIVRPLFTTGWLQMLLFHTCKIAGGRYIFLVQKKKGSLKKKKIQETGIGMLQETKARQSQ